MKILNPIIAEAQLLEDQEQIRSFVPRLRDLGAFCLCFAVPQIGIGLCRYCRLRTSEWEVQAFGLVAFLSGDKIQSF